MKNALITKTGRRNIIEQN